MLFLVQCGNGGVAIKAGNHASQRSAAGGGAGADSSSVSETEESRANPSLPEGVNRKDLSATTGASDIVYNFEQDENRVGFYTVGSSFDRNRADIIFDVDNRLDRSENLPAATRTAIARKVGQIMRYEASTRPDGFVFTNTAHKADGFGRTREALYGRAGFSLPYADGAQYAVVRNGRLVPAKRDGTPFNSAELAQHRTAVRDAIRQGAAESRRGNNRRSA